MKIEPKNGPAIVNPPTATTNTPTGSTARERAIAKLVGDAPAAQTNPVQNPTQVSPEEFNAIRQQAQKTETTAQNVTNEGQQSAETASEAPSEVTATETAAKPKNDPLSAQYAQLARKEKALRAKIATEQNTMRAREEALRQREEAIKAKEAEYQSNYISKSKLKSNPLGVLTEEGVTYEELTQAILNPQAQQDPRVMAELDRLKAEVQAQKQAQEDARKAYEAQKQAEYKQAVTEIRREAQQLVKVDPAFETIRETDSVSDVVELIEKTYHQDGVLLTVEEAAREVEEYLVEQATKIARLKKIQDRIKPASSASQTKTPSEPTKPETQQTQPKMNTLTNAVNASKPMTARERAIAAFNRQLK